MNKKVTEVKWPMTYKKGQKSLVLWEMETKPLMSLDIFQCLLVYSLWELE